MHFYEQEAYERTKEAKKAYFEYCKELSRGFVQLAPNRSREFLTYEKVMESLAVSKFPLLK